MTISVIVPVYKAESFLNRCIDSILRQSFTNYELILVDDGSPDRSGLLCDEYAVRDNRIRVIHQQNSGAAAARNAGLDTAKGRWIAFVDSDDWVHPDYLRMLYETALQHHADVVACRYETVREGACVSDEPEEISVSRETRESYWVGDRTGATVPWGKLYRKELFEARRFPVGRIGEDEFVTYRILFGCEKLVVLDNPLYRYFVNKDGISRSDYFKRLQDMIDCFEEHEAFFKDSPWQQAYRLEVEKHAEAYSGAIWLMRNSQNRDPEQLRVLRSTLRAYLAPRKHMIPFEKRKDIYIAAYPGHELLIRGFGTLKQLLFRER